MVWGVWGGGGEAGGGGGGGVVGGGGGCPRASTGDVTYRCVPNFTMQVFATLSMAIFLKLGSVVESLRQFLIMITIIIIFSMSL